MHCALQTPDPERSDHNGGTCEYVAQDTVVDCQPGCYTLLGWKVDRKEKKILDPIRVDWQPGMVSWSSSRRQVCLHVLACAAMCACMWRHMLVCACICCHTWNRAPCRSSAHDPNHPHACTGMCLEAEGLMPPETGCNQSLSDLQ
jgi:hypothetical protein